LLFLLGENMPPANSTAALAQMTQYQHSMQSPDQLVSGAEQSLGAPQAQQQVSGLRQAITNTTNLLNNVAPSVMGRTANSLVTSAQANRQIQNESAPIAKTLSDQTTKEAQAEADYNNLESKALSTAQLKQQSQNDKLAYLKSVYDALYGKEQDAAKMAEQKAEFAAQQRQAAASQALERQKLAEQVRSDKAQESLASQKTAAPSTQDYVKSMSSQLRSVAGRDGYVSPGSYASGMRAWVAAGLSPADYDKYMAVYRNPANGHYLLSNGTYSGA